MKSKYFWIYEGLVFGIIILFINLFTDSIQVENIVKTLPIYLIGGLVYGLIMKYIRKDNK